MFWKRNLTNTVVMSCVAAMMLSSVAYAAEPETDNRAIYQSINALVTQAVKTVQTLQQQSLAQTAPVIEEETQTNSQVNLEDPTGSAASKPEDQSIKSNKPQAEQSLKPAAPVTEPVESKQPVTEQAEPEKPVEPQAEVALPEPEVKQEVREYSQAVLDAIKYTNEARVKNGLAEYKIDDGLMDAADIRAVELEELYDHVRPNGQRGMMMSADLGFVPYGENIFENPKGAKNAVEGWMDSEGHRANILNPSFTHIGIGCYVGEDGTDYWVQIFGGKK